MNYATAFKIATAAGLKVYPVLDKNRAYVAVARFIEKAYSSHELRLMNKDPDIFYGQLRIDGILYLQRTYKAKFYKTTGDQKDLYNAWTAQLITEAQRIIALDNEKHAA
jgi:hypothetical protein